MILKPLNIIAAMFLMTCASMRATEAILSFSTSTGDGVIAAVPGFTFQPVTNISVTSLGCFDYLLPGQEPIEVGLWDSNGTLLASNSITSASPLVDQSRYEPVTPVILRAGLTYTVGVYSTNGGLVLEAEVPEDGGSATVSAGIELGTAVFSTNGWFSGLVFPTDQQGGPGAAALTANFEYAAAPTQSIPLSISIQDSEVVLTWTNAAFGLQTAPDLQSTFTNVPGATSPYTNIISAPQQFFRLIAN